MVITRRMWNEMNERGDPQRSNKEDSISSEPGTGEQLQHPGPSGMHGQMDYRETSENHAYENHAYGNYESSPAGRRSSERQYGRNRSHRRYDRSGRRNENASGQVKLTLPRFDGKTRWRTFINQFEAITEDWPVGQKLYHMLASLTGDAADFAFELDSYVRHDYEYLVEELQRRFKTTETPQTCARQFYRRRLRSGETLKEFASDLKTLVRKAYPSGLNRWAMEQMLVKQFFDGLGDDELRYNIEYVKMPKGLDEAVDLVYEHDEFRQIKRDSKHKIKMVRAYPQKENGTTEQPECSKQSTSTSRKERKEDVKLVPQVEFSQSETKELRAMLKRITERLDRLEGKTSKIDERACFKCGKTGHFQRNCTEGQLKSNKVVKAVYEEDETEEESAENSFPEDTCCLTLCNDCSVSDSEMEENEDLN